MVFVVSRGFFPFSFLWRSQAVLAKPVFAVEKQGMLLAALAPLACLLVTCWIFILNSVKATPTLENLVVIPQLPVSLCFWPTATSLLNSGLLTSPVWITCGSHRFFFAAFLTPVLQGRAWAKTAEASVEVMKNGLQIRETKHSKNSNYPVFSGGTP